MFFDEPMETMPRGEIERLQGERLRHLVARLYQGVPFYRAKLHQAGVDPQKVQNLDDLIRLPFTVKSDLRDHYPFGLFAVPRKRVIRLHASSGTTGKPTVVGYTRADLAIWADLCARCLVLAGAEPGEMLQNAYGYGLFTGGLGLHYGAERLGMTVVPVSGGNTARQIMLLRDFGPHLMSCTPSYALTLAERMGAEGIDPAALPLKGFLLGAEPWTEAMRDQIEALTGVHAINIYGLSEIIGPGVSNECLAAKDGSHVFEDHFIVEVIDPASGEPLEDGSPGELVFTTITKEAMPLLRYRTGDIASLTREPCICGRTHARMSRVTGRADDMMIIRGVNVFPSQIEAALLRHEALSPHHQIIRFREGHLEQIAVHCEVTPEFAAHHREKEASGWSELAGRVKESLRETLGLNVSVTPRRPGTLARSEGGKLSRVIDQRNLDACETGGPR